MKIALCLHGLFNSLQDDHSDGFNGHIYIKKNILNKFDTDVFIHSWEPDKQSLLEILYQPKAAIFEPQKDFSELIKERGLDKLEGCPRPPQSVLSHLYSVTEVMKLPYQQPNTKYDIIIKSRFDLGMINRRFAGPFNPVNPYPVQCINLQTDIEKGRLYNANWNHFHMGPADMWLYGSPDVMVEFTTLFSFLDEQMKIDSEFHKFATDIEGNKGDLSNSIAFYKWWMLKNDLWNNKINLDTIWE
jgi:hypothetical protein